MATADPSAGDQGGGQITTARDFAVERLQDAETPMAPAELANEYGCTNGHVRNLLADLLDEGKVERVGHGKYLATTSESDESSEEVSPDLHEEVRVQSSGNQQSTTDGTGPEETDEAADGEAPSEDSDTAAEDGQDGGDEMPTQEEYERQWELQDREIEDGDQTDDGDDQEAGVEEIGAVSEPDSVPTPGIDPRALMLLIAVAAVLYFGYKHVLKPSAQDSEDEPVQSPETTPSGGLVGA